MSLKSLRACAFVYYNRHSLHLANEACLLDAAAAVVTEFTTSLECQSPESKIWYAADNTDAFLVLLFPAAAGHASLKE